MTGSSESIYQKLATVFLFSFLFLLMTASISRPAESRTFSAKPVSYPELMAAVVSQHTDAVIQVPEKLPEFRQLPKVDFWSAGSESLSIRERLTGYESSIELNINLTERTRLAIDRVLFPHNIYHADSGRDDDAPVLS